MSEVVLVIGGGPAGMAAASKAKRERPDLKIIVAEAGKYVSFALCGIPYYIAGDVGSLEDLVHRTPEHFRKRGIDVRTMTRVVEVDLKGKRAVLLREDTGAEEEVSWDYLVVATGARPRRIPIDGADLPGVFTVRTLDDAEALRRESKKAERVVVVGGGYIGLELAEAFRRLGKDVTVIEARKNVLPNVDPEIAQLVERELAENGVTVRTGELVRAFEGRERVRSVVTEAGEYKADLVILAVGVVPNSEIVRDGVELGPRGSIKVDSRMRTSAEGVYAAGDIASTINVVTGKHDWIPLAHTANKMGRVAGANIAGIPMEFKGTAGTALIKVFDLEVGRTGLTEEAARREGFSPRSVIVKALDRPAYYPGAGQITVKVIYDEESRKLLGVQAAGKSVLARVNSAAVALFAGLKIDDLFSADFGYAPPFSPVWEPLVIASSLSMRGAKK